MKTIDRLANTCLIITAIYSIAGEYQAHCNELVLATIYAVLAFINVAGYAYLALLSSKLDEKETNELNEDTFNTFNNEI